MSAGNHDSDDHIEEIIGVMLDPYRNTRQLIVRNRKTGEMYSSALYILN